MAQIAILNIGSELLRGSIVNTNVAEIGKLLGNEGYTIQTQFAIHDAPEQIRLSLDQLLPDHDVIIITGGLGPTTDDLTKSTLAKYFGTQLVHHEQSLEHIKQLFAKFGKELNPSNIQQAMLPEACTILHNKYGTAMGMMFERDGKMIFSLPGVPFEMRHLIRDKVLPMIEEKHSGQKQLKRTIRTFGISESAAAEKMKSVAPLLSSEISVAYLPSFQGLKVELHARSANNIKTEKNLEDGFSLVRKAFGNYLYAIEDLPLESLLARAFKASGMTIATAESMTSGRLATALTSLSVSSAFFIGSVIAYHTTIKLNELDVDKTIVDLDGVVNSEVAKRMASGIRKKFRNRCRLIDNGKCRGKSNGTG